jgi:hippurate hydrolase
MNLIDDLKSAHSEIASWRQHLHENPDIAYEEKDTSNFVAAKLESFGVEVHRGFGGTGLVGVIHGSQGDPASGKAIGLRADMDALPMSEETNLAYASKRSGRMHACGHDGHTTMLLAAARHFAQTRNFHGTIYCIFQPAEEGGNAGARSMIKDGLFEKFHMDSVWGMHNWPGLEVGRAVAHCGAAMAGADIFVLTIDGKGGHAAMPHLTKDPVAAAGMCIMALQTLISRQLDPFDQAVISLTKLEAGSAFNVIPATASIGGTLRTMNAETRLRMIAEIETTAKKCRGHLGMQCFNGIAPRLSANLKP